MYRSIWASNWQAAKLARDIILSMISLHMIVHVSWFGKTGFESRKNELARSKFGKRVKRDAIRSYMIIIAGNFFFFFFGLLFFFRAGGAAYPYVTGKLERSCFAVTNGPLLQTPFAVGCMRKVNYAILVLSVLSMLISLLAVFSEPFSKFQNPFLKVKKFLFRLYSWKDLWGALGVIGFVNLTLH